MHLSEIPQKLGHTRTVLLLGASLLAMLVFATNFLRDYTVLLASLTAYGTSTLVCVVMSLMSRQRFDFDTIAQRVGDYDDATSAVGAGSDTGKTAGDRLASASR